MIPLKEQKEWKIIDSSKIETFLDCPRKYFFEHILGWKLNLPNHDAYFGESWHKAREHQLRYGYNDIEGAYNAFIEHYRKEFPPDTDNLYRPKDPTGVLNALMKFSEERSSDLIENEVVEIDGTKMLEISGTVPVDSKRVLHYRLDSIMRRKSDGKIFSWDHKSAKRFSRFWRDKFQLSIQNGTYTHCLYCMFPIEQVLGVEFCGTSFSYLTRGGSKNSKGYNITLERVPAFKTPDQMNTWLWTVVDILDSIEREMNRLFESSENESILMSFPMRPNNCTKYFGCAFHDYCISWPNPLQRCEEPPIGFKVEFWDPSKIESSVEKNLTW